MGLVNGPFTLDLAVRITSTTRQTTSSAPEGLIQSKRPLQRSFWTVIQYLTEISLISYERSSLILSLRVANYETFATTYVRRLLTATHCFKPLRRYLTTKVLRTKLSRRQPLAARRNGSQRACFRRISSVKSSKYCTFRSNFIIIFTKLTIRGWLSSKS